MTNNSARIAARRLMQASLDRGDALGWFEALYQQAGGNPGVVPWADMAANPNLVAWIEREGVLAGGETALVVGSGLGDDAEYLARAGFDVVGFDLSTTAIAWCRRRFPHSAVHYCVADLFEPPTQWLGRFNFVFEAYTLQTLPAELRRDAVPRIARFVAPGGRLLVISRGRDAAEDPGPLPWPLTCDEIVGFAACGLDPVSFEDYIENEEKPVRRFQIGRAHV